MNQEQWLRMKDGMGFIAALDQSGGSTPKTLKAYGIEESEYHNDDEMFSLIHEMRTRVITSKSFKSDKILAAILFENTMNRKIDGKYTADYLWNEKRILPILKVDKGLGEVSNGVRMMNPISNLDELLDQAVKRHIFGTKMRSVIMEANPDGIAAVVKQQFDIGKIIAKKGLVPIIEPEVDIFSKDKYVSEKYLRQEILNQLMELSGDVKVMLKLSIPELPDFYEPLINHEKILRVVALSGGYKRNEANEKLKQNHGMIASFSRALLQDLKKDQTDKEFDQSLKKAIDSIYDASVT